MADRTHRVRFKNGKLPASPGVYLMKDAAGRVLYVGKAANLRRRVASYFLRSYDVRIERLVRELRRVDYEVTGTAIEALIREAELIKKLEPPYNVREKDDTSFLFIVITREKFPRVLLARGTNAPAGTVYGPFTSASSLREAMRIVRRIFPWNTHDQKELQPLSNVTTVTLDSGPNRNRSSSRNRKGIERRGCFNYELGLCPGTCIGAADAKEYRKTIAQLKLFLAGKRKRLVSELTREMKVASRALNYERAEILRRRLFALQHIQDVALINDDVSGIKYPAFAKAMAGKQVSGENPIRIEGYDISNISGTSAVGSMVVFSSGGGSPPKADGPRAHASGGVDIRPVKEEYRKFAIRTVERADDTAMLREVLERRLRHREWPLPQLILVDGGVPQVNAARRTLRTAQLRIPIIGIAKGPERKRNDIIGIIPPSFAMASTGKSGIDKITLIKVRNEAHRFAVRYHRTVRGRSFLR